MLDTYLAGPVEGVAAPRRRTSDLLHQPREGALW
jgi:hypothetical protein